MTRHGKNSTANAVFSYHEKQQAGGGSKRQRITAQSIASFDACRLCLSRVKDPRLDGEGHLFCHECILESLLKQKKDIKRQQALLAAMKQEEAAQRADALEQARERVLKNFERTQSGVGLASSSKASSTASDSTVGTKRKLDLTGNDSLASLTASAEAAALAQLEREAHESRKAKLPNFWLPSLTPSAAPTKLEEVKLQTLCKVERIPHGLSLKELVKVRFGKVGGGEAVLDGGVGGGEGLCCMACAKGLNNNTKMSALRACGHILCHTCIDTLVLPSKQCATCDTPLDGGKKGGNGVIEMYREGTGFAAGGQAEATKFDLSFQ